MTSRSSAWSAYAAMALFVLLWGSAAIFTRWALDNGSVFAVLILRFAIALGAMLILAIPNRRWLPNRGTRWQVASTGVLMVAFYSVCYFEAMAHGVTPGLIATILGVQPILTLLITERRFSPVRMLGLLMALSGLVLVVFQSLMQTTLSGMGIAFALGALCCMTVGTLLQKRIHQEPVVVLPLQYVVTLLILICLAPFQPFEFEVSFDFLIPLLWLGLIVSTASSILLYRMIRNGNLVDVTSLFYLVPVVTVILDYLIFGNAMPTVAMVGALAILAGLVLVFRQSA